MKQLLLSFLFLLLGLTVSAQHITDVLAEMPEDVIPAFTEKSKRTLLEDSTATVVPTLLGEIRRVEYRDDYIMFQTSAVGSTQIKLLHTEQSDTLICVIQSVCGPACNSDIAFYNGAWERINDNDFLPVVTAEDFVTLRSEGNPFITVHSLLPDICPVSALFDEAGQLIMKLDISNYLSGEMLKEFEHTFEQKDLVLQWDGHLFR